MTGTTRETDHSRSQLQRSRRYKATTKQAAQLRRVYGVDLRTGNGEGEGVLAT